MLGYTRAEIQELFQNKFMRMVHPDDRRLAEEGAELLRRNTVSHNLEYRILGKHGYIWVIDQSKYMNFTERHFSRELLWM